MHENALHRMRRSLCICFALIAMLPRVRAAGSTVETMEMPKIADYAGQVIVGEVESVRSYWTDQPRRIESEITFKNVEYLKGWLADSTATFKLVVPGGKVGTTEMRICCAPTFDRGGRYVLFILPTYKTYPTVGLGQGAFQLLRDDQGVERVHQYGSQPVSGFSADGFVRLAGRPASEINEHLVDARGGVRLRLPDTEPRSAAATAPTAMSFADFTTYLRPILEKSRDHGLTEPAGKPVLVEKVATTLKAAPGSTSSTKSAATPSADVQQDSSSRQRAIRGVDAVREALNASGFREATQGDLKTGGSR